MRSFALALAVLALAPAFSGASLFPRYRLEAGYRSALERWAAGDQTGAVEAVRQLGDRAEDEGALTPLERARRTVARQLGRSHPDALLSIARLETLVYQAQVGARNPELALASRLLAAELAEQHAQRAGAAGRVPAAMVLASLGAHLHLAVQEGAAADLYQRALAIDPRQAAARLGLAALREKRGEYAAAVGLLAGVEPTPGGREGSLRLGVNLLRVGRRQEGEAELRALSGAGEDWVRSVAAQELARQLAGRGDGAGASELLAAAAAALPCDPSLPLQAALLAERRGDPLPLDLASLADCAETAISPRARYARAPAAEVRPLRQRLDALDPGWREALRRALGPAA